MTRRSELRLDELRAFSARIGRDRMLIQGAGGNTSIKIDGVLHVKASGTWLRDAEEQDVFLALPLDLVVSEARRKIAAGEELDATLLAPGHPMRPSIETVIHAMLPGRVVVHVHSVNTIAHAVRSDGRERIAERLAGLSWDWVPYARPGSRLGALLHGRSDADILILANHGLIIQADDVPSADELLAEVETRLRIDPRPARDPLWAELSGLAEGFGMNVPLDAHVHATCLDALALDVAGRGALYPDHVVYLGASPLPIVTADDSEAFAAQWLADRGRPLDCLLVRDVGVLVGPAANRGVEPMLDCLGMVLLRLDAPERTVFLTAEDEDALINWDLEKHRMKLAGGR